jgi:diacylglycerol kinase family enzyme
VIETADSFARALDIELELVESAIRLVASGAATRVAVANLAYGRVVIEPARRLALEGGVDLETVPAANPTRVTVIATIAPRQRGDG